MYQKIEKKMKNGTDDRRNVREMKHVINTFRKKFEENEVNEYKIESEMTSCIGTSGKWNKITGIQTKFLYKNRFKKN